MKLHIINDANDLCIQLHIAFIRSAEDSPIPQGPGLYFAASPTSVDPARRLHSSPTMITQEQVEQALGSVIDPELGINVVDLGLVYGVDIQGDAIRVRLSMTSPTCPMGEHLRDQATRAVRERVPGAGKVDVDLVREPAWHPGMMSETARRMLG